MKGNKMFGEQSINGWYINPDPYSRNKYQGDGHSFRVNLCPSCKKAYEYFHLHGQGTILIYHRDFPTYKINREVCRNCG